MHNRSRLLAYQGTGAVTTPSQGPRWLPWVIVGGAALVGGGIIYTAVRSRRSR